MDTKKKTERVVNSTPAEKRAFGVKLPFGNPTIIAYADAATSKLPANLLALYEKVAAKGKDGVKLSTLCPKTPEGKYTRWLVRQLVKQEAFRAEDEPKVEKIAKPKKAAKAAKTKNPLAKAA